MTLVALTKNFAKNTLEDEIVCGQYFAVYRLNMRTMIELSKKVF